MKKHLIKNLYLQTIQFIKSEMGEYYDRNIKEFSATSN